MLTNDDLQNIKTALQPEFKQVEINVRKALQPEFEKLIVQYLKPIKAAVTKVSKEEHTTTGFLDRRDLWMMKRIDKLEVKAGVEHPPQNF